jgi:hypothetical protein
VPHARQHSNGEHLERVNVLQAGFQTKAYTIFPPASRYAACTCATAMQRIICKHQVAWLVALAPLVHRADVECLSVLMLGTRLGFTGGASMEDNSSLTHALHDPSLSTASIASSGIPLAAAFPINPPSCCFSRCPSSYSACSSSWFCCFAKHQT